MNGSYSRPYEPTLQSHNVHQPIPSLQRLPSAQSMQALGYYPSQNSLTTQSYAGADYSNQYHYPQLSFLSAQQQQLYLNVFKSNAQQYLIPSNHARDIMLQSGLSPSELAMVWSLCYLNPSVISPSHQGLTFAEFALAMYLIQRRLTIIHEPLPAILPMHISQEIQYNILQQFGHTPSALVSPTLPTSSRLSVSHGRPSIPWAIGAEEKAKYDTMFHEWDGGSGSISGEKARDIFLRSGIPPSELWQIWNLADMHNRGKLNSDEFAVAMHLIYKRLAGGTLPHQLPHDLIPPSDRGLSQVVSMAKDHVVRDVHEKRRSQSHGDPRTSTLSTNTSELLPVSPGSKLAESEDLVSGVYRSSRRRSDRPDVSQGHTTVLEKQDVRIGVPAHPNGTDHVDQAQGKVFVAAPSISKGKMIHPAVDVPNPQASEVSKPSTEVAPKIDIQSLHSVQNKLQLEQNALTTELTSCEREYSVSLEEMNDVVKTSKTLLVTQLLKHVELDVSSLMDPQRTEVQLKLQTTLQNYAESAFAIDPLQIPAKTIAELSGIVVQVQPVSVADKEAEVKAKAAKMLADRMAKMGIQAPVSTIPSPTLKPKSNDEILLDLFQKLQPISVAFFTTQRSKASGLESKLGACARRKVELESKLKSVNEQLTALQNQLQSLERIQVPTKLEDHSNTTTIQSNATVSNLMTNSQKPQAGQVKAAEERLAQSRKNPISYDERKSKDGGLKTMPSGQSKYTESGQNTTKPAAEPQVTVVQSKTTEGGQKPMIYEQTTTTQERTKVVSPSYTQLRNAQPQNVINQPASTSGEASASMQSKIKQEQQITAPATQTVSPAFKAVSIEQQRQSPTSSSEKSSNFTSPIQESVMIRSDALRKASILPPTSVIGKVMVTNPIIEKPVTTDHNTNNDDWLSQPSSVHTSPVKQTSYKVNDQVDDKSQTRRLYDEIKQVSATDLAESSISSSIVDSQQCVKDKINLFSQKTIPSENVKSSGVKQVKEKPQSTEDVFGDTFSYSDPNIIIEESKAAKSVIPYPFVITQVIYTYNPAQPDELQLNPGIFVSVPDLNYDVSKLVFTPKDSVSFTIESSEWWYGRSDQGQMGWFPASYVRIILDPRRRPDFGNYQIIDVDTDCADTSHDSKLLKISKGSKVICLDSSDPNMWKCMSIESVDGLGTVGICPVPRLRVPRSPTTISENPFLNEHAVVKSQKETSLKVDTSAKSIFQQIESASKTPFTLVGGTEQSPTIARVRTARLRSLSTPYQSSFDPLQTENWARLIDENELPGIDAVERKRQEAIFELLRTENKYVRDLQLVVEVFYLPMRQMLSSTDFVGIFTNVEDVLLCNTKILSDLEAEQQKDDLLIQCIGHILLKHFSVVDSIPDLKSVDLTGNDTILVYMRYCGNQMLSSRLLQQKRGEIARLGDFLKSIVMSEKRCRSLDLSSFLLEPMQRITRYPLLIKQILHYTPKDHPDHRDLLKALGLAEKLLTEVNGAARESESRMKMAEVASMVDLQSLQGEKLDLTNYTRYLGPRECLHEGILFKSKSGRKLYVYLFNDLILMSEFARKENDNDKIYSLYRKPLPLNEIVIRAVPGSRGGDDLHFQIVYGEDIIGLKAPDKKSKSKWMTLIESANTACLQVERVRQKAKQSDSTQLCIGTVNVSVYDCLDMALDPQATKTDIFCLIKLDRQQQKTRLVEVPLLTKQSHTARWNQSFVFSVQNLDDLLKFEVYAYDKYAQDELIGRAEMALHILEYYNNRETEMIHLKMNGNRGSIRVKLHYNHASL